MKNAENECITSIAGEVLRFCSLEIIFKLLFLPLKILISFGRFLTRKHSQFLPIQVPSITSCFPHLLFIGFQDFGNLLLRITPNLGLKCTICLKWNNQSCYIFTDCHLESPGLMIFDMLFFWACTKITYLSPIIRNHSCKCKKIDILLLVIFSGNLCRSIFGGAILSHIKMMSWDLAG